MLSRDTTLGAAVLRDWPTSTEQLAALCIACTADVVGIEELHPVILPPMARRAVTLWSLQVPAIVLCMRLAACSPPLPVPAYQAASRCCTCRSAVVLWRRCTETGWCFGFYRVHLHALSFSCGYISYVQF